MVVKDERGQSDEEVPNRVNPLQLLNALSVHGVILRGCLMCK